MEDQKFTQLDPSAPPNNIVTTPDTQDTRRRRLFHRIFFGDEGLRAGWGILFFVLLCFGSNYAVSRLHLLPSQPHTTPGQSSPELPPVGRAIRKVADWQPRCGTQFSLRGGAFLLLSKAV